MATIPISGGAGREGVDASGRNRAARTRPLALLLALSLFAFAFQGSRALFQPDEGRYAAVALRMLETGDYLIPELEAGTPHLTKPPLTYWAIAASLRAFGQNEWAARLPLALAFIATTVLVHAIARRLAPDVATLAALVFATFFLPYGASNALTSDTLLALWVTSAVHGFVRLRWDEDGPRERWRWWLWASLGLAFLTKGPPGLLPLLAMVVFVAFDRAWPLRRLLSIGSASCFVLVGLGWYLLLLRAMPGALDYFLRFEIYDRLFSSVHDRSPEWYGGLQVHGPVLLLGTLPWTPVLLAAVWRKLAAGRRGGSRAPSTLGPEGRWLALWIAVPLTIFLLARSRLPLYTLPLFPPLAIVVARLLGSGFRLEGVRRVALLLWIVALMALRWQVGALAPDKDTRSLAAAISAQTELDFERLVFIATTPFHGIGFYLPLEARYVCLHEDTAPPRPLSPYPSLLDEMATTERRLFVTEARRLSAVEQFAEKHGLRVEPVGRWHEYALMRIAAPVEEHQLSPSR